MNADESFAEVFGPQPAPPMVEIPSVDWWVTSRCNLKCDFCYGPVPARDPAQQRAEIQKRAEIGRVLAASSARVVTFCGGEPLLVRGIGRQAATLRQHGKETVLNTNGEFLRKRIEQGLPLDCFTWVGISVDGPTSDIHRRMRGTNADLEEALKAARLVARHPGVRLKLATVVSGVNKDSLPTLARIVHRLSPAVWRLYQYSSRGDQNFGQQRHRITDDEFSRLVKEAANLAAPVEISPSSEAKTAGCLIVDPNGDVLQPSAEGYIQRGNCLDEPIDDIWTGIPGRETIVDNKDWLSRPR